MTVLRDDRRTRKTTQIDSFKWHKIFLGFLLAVVAFPLFGNKPVSAATNCRAIARRVQADAASAGRGQSSELAKAFIEKVGQAAVEYPECESELRRLWAWNAAADPSVPFPFAKSGDPRSNTLGPISWWWDTVYNGLLGGSTVLMVIFGWEIFLAPFPIIISLLLVPFAMARDQLRSRRRRDA